MSATVPLQSADLSKELNGVDPVTRTRILVVEDEPIIALDLRQRLELLGYVVAGVVDTGEEAVCKTADQVADLILMDINLAGEMDGVDAAHQIRREHPIPIIFLTASSSPATLERAKLTEPAGFLLKPFENRKLETIIPIALYKHQAEQALRDSEARFRTLVEHAPEAILVYDADLNRFVDANENAEKVFGLQRQSLPEIGPLEVSPPAQPNGDLSSEAIWEHISRALSGHAPVVEWTFGSPPDQETIVCEVRLVQLPAAGRRLVRASIIDISERKRLEQGTIAVERLRALEGMAHGIAHNFNNILAGIFGYAELIRRDSADAGISSKIEQVIAGANRAKELVQCLRKAMRGIQHEALQPVDLNDVVREVVQATRPRWHHEAAAGDREIGLMTELEEVPPVRGTHPGLYDMIVNLIFNAVEALPQGGRISVSTSRRTGHGEAVVLRVSDTGKGMSDTTLARMFEPFFTTKKDVGSGLGLFTVYGTITRWGGTVDARSGPEIGTTLTITLPVWAQSGDDNGANAELLLTGN